MTEFQPTFDPQVDVTELRPVAFDRSQGRDELNLAEFPLFYLGLRIPKGLDRLSFENEINDPARNRKVKRRLEIQSGGDGLPTVRDMDVLDALILIGKQTNNLESAEIYFSRYQLCEILGWPQNGKSYKRIEEALRRWVTVTLFYQAWWDRNDDKWSNLKGFHIVDEIELNDYNTGRIGRTTQTELPLSKIRLGRSIFESLQSGNVKRLNLADLFHLKLPASKRLYRFLDKRFFHNPRQSFDLRCLACEHVGLSREYKTSSLKRKLQPAIDELVELGFLVPANEGQRYTRVSHGSYQVHFQRATRQTIGDMPLAGPKKQRTTNRQLIKQLTDHGVTAITARKLVEDETIDEKRIREKIEMLQWYLERDREEAPKNPGGWLAKAIRDDYSRYPGSA